MLIRKFVSVFLALTAVACLTFTSCKKCPIFGKLCGVNNVSSQGLKVADVRIGTGDSDITAGTNLFNRDERIIITFDVKNMTTLLENPLLDEKVSSYWIREDITIRDGKGGVVKLIPSIIDGKQPVFSKPLKFKNSFTLSDISGIKPGRYTVSLLVTDLISFQTAVETIPIVIK